MKQPKAPKKPYMMNPSLAILLEGLAITAVSHDQHLDSLSERQKELQQRQRQVSAQIKEVLLMLLTTVDEQVRFGRIFVNQWESWKSPSRSQSPLPRSMSELLCHWYESFPSEVRHITAITESSMDYIKVCRKLARELLDEIEVLHGDDISAVQRKVEKLSQGCLAEQERLIRRRDELISERDKLVADSTAIQRESQEIEAAAQRSTRDKSSRNVGIAGAGLGMAALGLSMLFPPAALVAGAASTLVSWTGAGMSAVDLHKEKKLKERSEALACRTDRLGSDVTKLQNEAALFAEENNTLPQVNAAIDLLLDKYDRIKAIAETLEKQCVADFSATIGMTSRLSGILASSTALEMSACHENLIVIVEDILSDFSHCTQESRVQNVLSKLMDGLGKLQANEKIVEVLRIVEARDDYGEWAGGLSDGS